MTYSGWQCAKAKLRMLKIIWQLTSTPTLRGVAGKYPCGSDVI